MFSHLIIWNNLIPNCCHMTNIDLPFIDISHLRHFSPKEHNKFMLQYPYPSHLFFVLKSCSSPSLHLLDLCQTCSDCIWLSSRTVHFYKLILHVMCGLLVMCIAHHICRSVSVPCFLSLLVFETSYCYMVFNR
jgi:hypothetical protein